MNLMYRSCSIGYYGSTYCLNEKHEKPKTYQLWKRTTSLLDSQREGAPAIEVFCFSSRQGPNGFLIMTGAQSLIEVQFCTHLP